MAGSETRGEMNDGPYVSPAEQVDPWWIDEAGRIFWKVAEYLSWLCNIVLEVMSLPVVFAIIVIAAVPVMTFGLLFDRDFKIMAREFLDIWYFSIPSGILYFALAATGIGQLLK